MAIAQRVVVIATSAIAIAGVCVLFFMRKRRGASVLNKGDPKDERNKASRETSPTVVLTQSSAEGRKVSVLHEGYRPGGISPVTETFDSPQDSENDALIAESVSSTKCSRALSGEQTRINDTTFNGETSLHNDSRSVESDSTQQDCVRVVGCQPTTNSSEETGIVQTGSQSNTVLLSPECGDVSSCGDIEKDRSDVCKPGDRFCGPFEEAEEIIVRADQVEPNEKPVSTAVKVSENVEGIETTSSGPKSKSAAVGGEESILKESDSDVVSKTSADVETAIGEINASMAEVTAGGEGDSAVRNSNTHAPDKPRGDCPSLAGDGPAHNACSEAERESDSKTNTSEEVRKDNELVGQVAETKLEKSVSNAVSSNKRTTRVNKAERDSVKIKTKQTSRDVVKNGQSPKQSGSHSPGETAPEQCQSSDSGVSVHSEAEASGNDEQHKASVREKPKPPETEVYEFDFPSPICGMLIGHKGRTIRQLMDQSGASITLKAKLYDQEHQTVAVRGKPDQIKAALKLIKEKFPKRKFRIDFSPSKPEHPVLSPDLMQLSIPEGVAIDVIVSSVVTANHIFLQQPTHPAFHLLQRQNQEMNLCYSQGNGVPELPRPIDTGVICAAPMYDGWFRCQVVQADAQTDECDIRFVDYGGYMKTTGSALRQIRSDFTELPFHAVECYLANVVPSQGKQEFCAEANALLEEMVQGHVLQAEVVGYETDGVPYVQLYIVSGDQLILVNRELVNKGVARWAEMF